MRALSALADAGLLLPAAFALLLYLLVRRQGLAALAFAAALGSCGVATIAAKLLFHACGASLTDLDVVSPSGHASFATAFYGSLAILVGTGRVRWQRALLAVSCAVLLAGIGVSRVVLRTHSVAEVVIGLALGAAAVALFAALHARIGRPILHVLPLAAGFLVAVALLGGRSFTLEGGIARTARHLAASLDVCRDAGPRHAARLSGRLGR